MYLNIITQDPGLLDILKRVVKLSTSFRSMLIHGETGTGKEEIVNIIEKHSNPKKPFFRINLMGINPELLESELFGYVKGAFTGADTEKRGLIEQAEGGIIFFDEFGDVPSYLQSKLLRLIRERQFHKVGEATKIRTHNVRFIFATSRPIAHYVQEGKILLDFLNRMDDHIYLPPLRDRGEDVILLFNYFLETISREQGVMMLGYDDAIEHRLRSYPFSGNIAELYAIVSHLVRAKPMGVTPQVVSLHDFETCLEQRIHIPKETSSDLAGDSGSFLDRLLESYVHTQSTQRLTDYIKSELIQHAYSKNNKCIKATATQLRLSVSTVYRLVGSR